MADQPLIAWRTTVKRRLAVAAAIFGLWSLLIQGRLVYFQVVKSEWLTEQGKNGRVRVDQVRGKRGKIVDRRGQDLAVSVPAPSINADPSLIKDVQRTIDALCEALEDCSEPARKELRAKLTRNMRHVPIASQVPFEVASRLADRLAELKLKGISVSDESRRYYPNKELGAAVVGRVGREHHGQSGIELAYNDVIQGEPGTATTLVLGKRVGAGTRIDRAPTVGATLELTLDENVQHIAERELEAGVKAHGAVSGSVVVLDPVTGELYAIATYPGFNPNVRLTTADVLRNRAVEDMYEPGSTMKIVTMAAALETGIAHPDDLIDTSGGRIEVNGKFIYDTDDYGVLSLSDVFVKSSNVGAIKTGWKLGAAALTDFIKRFGFGSPTSRVSFRGESSGKVWDPADLKEGSLARVSIGYQIGVTPLQMAAAAGAIANGGELVRPRIVRAEIRNGVRTDYPREVIRRAVSSEVATQVTAMMEGVVERGTGTNAQIPGYTVAGKTGTAQRLIDGDYSTTEYHASFVGFVPSRNPRFVIVVVIDSPDMRKGYYGGVVAAPVFKRIAEAVVRYEGVPPTVNPQPPLLVRREIDRRNEQPASGPVGAQPMVAASLAEASNDGLVPSVIGMSARDALGVFTKLGHKVHMDGHGLVIEQRPSAGVPIQPGMRAHVRLGRPQPVSQTASFSQP